MKTILVLDEGGVEAIPHYCAATFFEFDADCILDTNSQNMKCIKVKDNTVNSVQLNKAYSFGCGSFTETLVKSLNYSVEDFAKGASFARNPTDSDTCRTVFMNPNVKQAQKEGASMADISAGSAYSVIKNALYKAIEITSPTDSGSHVVIQGGTFYNGVVLRNFEKISGCRAVYPSITGIIDAFGAALIARERYDGIKATTILSLDKIIDLEYKTRMTRCKGCTNNYILIANRFRGNRRLISGNRCERSLNKGKVKHDVPNLFDYKYRWMFSYETLMPGQAPRGTVGVPRVLNMYENYPCWAVFFKELGFRIVLSPQSTRDICEFGTDSILSESECYPAKLAHGYISWLIAQGIQTIFYPCIPYECNELSESGNHYNYPVVASYAKNIKNNMEELAEEHIRFLNPFMAFANKDILIRQLVQEFQKEFHIPVSEVQAATHKAWEELLTSRRDIERRGEETFQYLKTTGKHGIMLAGRPYHVNPEIHHEILELITSYGLTVLTENSIPYLGETERSLVVASQWIYHFRLYAAASYIRTSDCLDLVQLNSFGYSLDAVATDQIHGILANADKIHTVLKIDEINNPGTARIHVRFLTAALRVREKSHHKNWVISSAYNRVIFTKEMKKGYTLLCPQMSPIRFDLLEPATRSFGYNIEVLQSHNRSAVDVGFQYVNNDTCYPSLITIGQIMDVLLSGKYDLDYTAVLMSQTGGGCHASNYVGFIRRALGKADIPQVPVTFISANGVETNPGFTFTLVLLAKAM